MTRKKNPNVAESAGSSTPAKLGLELVAESADSSTPAELGLKPEPEPDLDAFWLERMAQGRRTALLSAALTGLLSRNPSIVPNNPKEIAKFALAIAVHAETALADFEQEIAEAAALGDDASA